MFSSSNTGLFDTAVTHIDGSSSLILVEEAVSIVSFVLIMILFWWTFLSFQNSTTSIVSGYKLKYLCLISLLSFFFMSFISSMMMSNMITQHLTLKMCRIIYPLYFTFYNIGKISIYCLLSFRQQLMFNKELYSKQLAISPFVSNILRLFSIFIPSMLWLLFIFLGFDHIELITIPNPGAHTQDYKYCAMRLFDWVLLAQMILAFIGIFDTVFRSVTLSIFITKSIKVITYYKQNINPQKRDIITKLTKLMRKTNVLDVISIISTLLFLVCSSYIFQQLIYFLIIDAVICSVCIIGLFQFGNSLYLATCFKCESYCICLICLEKELSRTSMSTVGYQTFQDDMNMVKQKSVHLKKTSANGYGANGNTQPLYDVNDNISYSGKMNATMSGLIQNGTTAQNEDRKDTATYITLLSGHDNVEPGELEISTDVVDNRRNSLLSVSDFL